LIEPDPQDWGWWVVYLIEQLEEEAKWFWCDVEIISTTPW
jgi:hypothetical protein